MTENLGKTDRIVRTAIGAGLVGIGLMRKNRMLGLLGLYPLITGITGSCPIYTKLGISTHRTIEDEMLDAFDEPIEVAAP
jgi:hypothetical protein